VAPKSGEDDRQGIQFVTRGRPEVVPAGAAGLRHQTGATEADQVAVGLAGRHVGGGGDLGQAHRAPAPLDRAEHGHGDLDRAERPVADYVLRNFLITTSGNFTTQALLSATMSIGSDRILFSTDRPFENVDHAARWFDQASISETDRLKIGRTNALREFRLG
jgi:hypothetical protein